MLWLVYNKRTGEGWVFVNELTALAVRFFLGLDEWEVCPLA